MNDTDTDMDTDIVAGERDRTLVSEHRLDAPVDKVWRAIRIPELREHWLPGSGQGQVLAEQPGRLLELALREAEPPFLESTVRFALRPDAAGGTWLTIVHALAPRRLAREAANDGGFLMRA